MSKQQEWVLKAVENFECLGTSCPKTCCHGWDIISIDTGTLGKWNEHSDESEKQYLLDSIEYLEENTPQMKFNAENFCQSLDENKLCTIQNRFGHEYLSETCQKFPRLFFNNKYRKYKSASFSCPEIVDKALFSKKGTPLFVKHECSDELQQESSGNEKVLYKLNELLDNILEKPKFLTGVKLFFISDVFANLINLSKTNELNEQIIQEVIENTEIYLTDISNAVRNGKLEPNPVTAGSFWKNVYALCESRKVDKQFLADPSGKLYREIIQCDDSFAGFGKVYTAVNQLRKKAKKQLRNEYHSLFEKYIKVIFVNNGFPSSPLHPLDMLLVDSMVGLCVLQLLLWIEVEKNGKISDQFMKECIVEVDRKFVHHNGVFLLLKENQHMMQIEKYCPTFIDVF